MRPFVMSLLALLLSSTLAAAEPVTLTNTAIFQDKLATLLAERPASTDHEALYGWLWKLSSAYMRLRRYDDMETVCKAILSLTPNDSICHTNLSVAYGKQGKYPLAIEEAKIGALLNPSDTMHAESVLCSWLYLSGRKSEALAAISSMAPPADPRETGLYFACRASFFASVGDVPRLKEAIGETLKDPDNHRSFFERDIAFDPYRNQDWFIALIGRTIADK